MTPRSENAVRSKNPSYAVAFTSCRCDRPSQSNRSGIRAALARFSPFSMFPFPMLIHQFVAFLGILRAAPVHVATKVARLQSHRQWLTAPTAHLPAPNTPHEVNGNRRHVITTHQSDPTLGPPRQFETRRQGLLRPKSAPPGSNHHRYQPGAHECRY